MNTTWVLRTMGLLSLTLLVACKPPGEAKKTNDLDAPPQKTTALSVQTSEVKAGKLTVSRSVSATVTAERDSRVATNAGGTVQQVLVQEGQTVSAGEAVLQLDSTQQRQALESAQVGLKQAQISLEQARSTTTQSGASLGAAVRSAEAALAQAQATAQSTENLYGLGGVSQADLQAARSGLAQAQSALAQARQNLAQNGQSAQNSIPLQQTQVQSAQVALRQAQENLNRTTVRAPFGGTVADLLVQEGEFAAQGSAVFRLVDTGSLRVKFSVPAADAVALPEGTAFNVGYGGKNYVGRVVDSSGIAGTDRLVPITARLDGNVNLPVGATAQARYRATLGQGVLVPGSAVQASGAGNAVFTVEGGRARRQDVSVIAESGGQVAVSNLAAGTRVIAPIPGSLQDGAKVSVATGSAP
ncbi:efflux RND transporter periplasmic adaptor subunit [Deinococcus cavernae]|uniref:Efflux RND transporter periplasmic adaptor subunit n=1 Tax=Deinococcus cavernae TaxID=2320857 RepID=A0A418V032_9DEIO|nr:efflux RND transporter periplasmic adaptor subunit [Deinococcus cavernae]RJF69091.1 efflux RND transporter periplasmic adaptor subunit [Deinococcus cavernae]